MKKIAMIAAVVTIFTIATATAATTEELLKQRLDTAVKVGDWKAAESISAIMANMATVANQQQQAELFRQNNVVMTGVMNIYKAAPQLLQIAQRITPGEKGTEEHLFLQTLAPAVIKLISTGEVDPDKIVRDINEHQKAEKARWAEREKRWQLERRSNRR